MSGGLLNHEPFLYRTGSPRTKDDSLFKGNLKKSLLFLFFVHEHYSSVQLTF